MLFSLDEIPPKSILPLLGEGTAGHVIAGGRGGGVKISQQNHALTFTCWSHPIKSTSSAAAISSTRPCVGTNERKPSVTVVGSHRIKSIGAVFNRGGSSKHNSAIAW